MKPSRAYKKGNYHEAMGSFRGIVALRCGPDSGTAIARVLGEIGHRAWRDGRPGTGTGGGQAVAPRGDADAGACIPESGRRRSDPETEQGHLGRLRPIEEACRAQAGGRAEA